MKAEEQKRTVQVSISLTKKEEMIIKEYLQTLDIEEPLSMLFRKAMLEKIKRETKSSTTQPTQGE